MNDVRNQKKYFYFIFVNKVRRTYSKIRRWADSFKVESENLRIRILNQNSLKVTKRKVENHLWS